METKDWIYTVGLVLTFGISAVSLYVTVKNRKNAIREHLYKEQLAFFLKFQNEFAVVMHLFDELSDKPKDNKDTFQMCLYRIHQLDILFSGSDILVPNDLYNLMSRSVGDCYKFHALLLQKGEAVTEAEMDSFIDRFFDTEDEVREFIGVDKLSKENRKLIGKSET